MSTTEMPLDTDRSAVRRARFRDAVSGLAKRAQRADLLQWVIVPGSFAVILGFLFLLFGWFGASRTFREIEQIPYLISGGMVGLALVFLGGLMLASAFWIVLLRKSREEADARFLEHSRAFEERMAELVRTLSSKR
jgi:hypothetical protein